MTQQAITVSGKTGGICQVTGPYASERNKSAPVFFTTGDKFPVDFYDGKATTWWMIKE